MMTSKNDSASRAVGRPEADGNSTLQMELCLDRPATVNHRGDSIIGEVRDALLRGERLTALDAWARFGTSRLAAVVHRLKKIDGLDIATETVEIDCAHGHRAAVARYWVPGAEVRHGN